MDYGNKKKKMGAGGVSGERKKMRMGGSLNAPIPVGLMPKKPLGPPKLQRKPKVPMKMDAMGRKGMMAGGTTGKGTSDGEVISFSDYVKNTFGS